MNRWLVNVSKEILKEKQDAHVIAFKVNRIQERINQACKADTLHVKELAN